MRPEDWLGWGASALLIITLLHQIRTQLRSRDTRAVSPWLFVGQSAASVGFICYSALLGNLVFIVTNSLILATAVLGQVMLSWRNRRRKR
ncbi:MAG TPA: hypothetical protein VM687_16720 [Stenotrophomonas sp.]|nr:hypothetical protein [Stenotrophomonas sp.]